MKTYMIILDGAADRKIGLLGNKTPLQVANTPSLDSLATQGAESLITVIDENITPESDSGCMALLSYDPRIYYPGRGTPIKNYDPSPQQCVPLDNSKESKLTADIVNSFVMQSNNILSKNPINIARMEQDEMPANLLLFRDGGQKPKEMPEFSKNSESHFLCMDNYQLKMQ